MNIMLISHIATELIIFSTLTIYFNKRINAQQEHINILRQQVDEHDKKLNALYQQFQLLVSQRKDELDEMYQPPSSIRRRIINNDQPPQLPPQMVIPQGKGQPVNYHLPPGPTPLQQQQMHHQQMLQQMMQQQIPNTQHEEQLQVQPQQQTPPQVQPQQVQNPQIRIISQGMPMFPVEALLGSLMPQMPSKQQKEEVGVEVEVEDEDIKGIEEELASLNQNTKQN